MRNLAPASSALVGQDVQQATLAFFGPVTAAWLAICAVWLALPRVWPALRAEAPPARSERPWLDVGWALGAVVMVLGLGEAYRRQWLLPRGDGWLGLVLFDLNQLIIFAPVAAVMLHRGQGPETAFLPRAGWLPRSFAGALLGLGGAVVFLGLRGELARGPALLEDAVAPRSLAHFLPVFLEGFGIAFLFVRVRWLLGSTLALLVPCLLFAVAHVPRGVQEGQTTGTLAAFFVLNTVLPLTILGTTARMRDVVALGVAHYVMDIAIAAFH